MDKKTILVVDDTDWNRDLLVQLLEEEYTVFQAVDGEEGVKMTQDEKPDLILMDLGMPVMDGWEATAAIKANDALKQIPIIAVTSHAMVGDEIDARKAGCDDYLPKPIDEDVLMQKIKKSFSRDSMRSLRHSTTNRKSRMVRPCRTKFSLSTTSRSILTFWSRS